MKHATPVVLSLLASASFLVTAGMAWWSAAARPPATAAAKRDVVDRRSTDETLEESNSAIVEAAFEIAELRFPAGHRAEIEGTLRFDPSTPHAGNLRFPDAPELIRSKIEFQDTADDASIADFQLVLRAEHDGSSYPFDGLDLLLPLPTVTVDGSRVAVEPSTESRRPARGSAPEEWWIATTERVELTGRADPQPGLHLHLRRHLTGPILQSLLPLLFLAGLLAVLLRAVTPPQLRVRDRALPYGWAIVACALLGIGTAFQHRAIHEASGGGAVHLQLVYGLVDLFLLGVAALACLSCRNPRLVRTCFGPLLTGLLATLALLLLEGWSDLPEPVPEADTAAAPLDAAPHPEGALIFAGDLVIPSFVLGLALLTWLVWQQLGSAPRPAKPIPPVDLVHFQTTGSSTSCGSRSTRLTRDLDAVTCRACQRRQFEDSDDPAPLDTYPE